MRPEVPVAGERFTLICRVQSDLPATLSWRGPSGNISDMTVDGATTTLSLTFDSLRMSHGGIYECLSEVNNSSPDNTSSSEILVQVEGRPQDNVQTKCVSVSLAAVPPVVTISRGSSGRVELFSDEILVCIADIIDEIDVPVTVNIEWDFPLFTNENEVSTSDVSQSGSTYTSVMTISNFTVRESGDYSCTASVTPVDSGSSGGVSDKIVNTTEYTHLRTRESPNDHTHCD